MVPPHVAVMQRAPKGRNPMSESNEMELDVLSASGSADSAVPDGSEVQTSQPPMPLPDPAVGDVPHATRRQMIVVVRGLAGLGGAATMASIAAAVAVDGVSKRHAGYALADGAEIIGLVRRNAGKWVLTADGQRLAGTVPNSLAETAVLKEALSSNNGFVSRVVTGPEIPSVELHELVRAAGFSKSSAERRVPCLRSWRKLWQTL